MARLPRFDTPGVPQHIVQRGNDRLPCFTSEADYVRYLQDLREAALREGCAVHAYVLMTNHVHLLLTPAALGAAGRMMQALGRCYVAYFNARYHRTGTLWEGRYKACLVDSDDYLLRCYRYIELNPVRARMIVDASDYRWSSYRRNAQGSTDQLIQEHASYTLLGADPVARMQNYAALVAEAVNEAELAEIRAYVQQGRALGSPRFQSYIEALHGRSAAIRSPGRPSQRE